MLLPLLARVLVLSLVSASITHANAPLTEPLTCDVATTRALAQLHARIQRERTAQRITSDELATAVPPETLHTWDATRHQCRGTVRIEIPVLPRPTLRRPTTDIMRGFVLHVGRPQTDTASPRAAHP